jgi:NAD(P)-dependent dehydrogenase (short-subunit alcohol dehydrogenase family)
MTDRGEARDGEEFRVQHAGNTSSIGCNTMAKDKSFSWRRASVGSLDLKGKKAVVVGGTGGLGRALSRMLAGHDASVVVVGQTFRDSDLRGIEFIKADLSLMSEAKRVAALLPVETADLVIFTTGIMAGPEREVTPEGIERDMAVSYLNRLVMLRDIGPRLGRDRPASTMKPRVFIMGFPGIGQAGKLGDLNAEKSYGRWAVHSNTVAGNEATVLDAVTRYPHANFFGLNPGLAKTNIRSNLFGKNTFLKSLLEWATGFMTIAPETYAERIVPLLVSPDLEGHSGTMFNNKADAILPTKKLTDATHRDAFLSESQALVARKTGIKLSGEVP